jgi:hypothetical protein
MSLTYVIVIDNSIAGSGIIKKDEERFTFEHSLSPQGVIARVVQLENVHRIFAMNHNGKVIEKTIGFSGGKLDLINGSVGVDTNSFSGSVGNSSIIHHTATEEGTKTYVKDEGVLVEETAPKKKPQRPAIPKKKIVRKEEREELPIPEITPIEAEFPDVGETAEEFENVNGLPPSNVPDYAQEQKRTGGNFFNFLSPEALPENNPKK